MKNVKSAFSIIELVFAIVIIGVIAAVAIPRFMNSKTSATVSSLKQDITTITTSVQSYFIINSKIEKISDAVTLNPAVWNIEDKKVDVSFDNQECISFEIAGAQLKLQINETSSAICQKVYKAGVRNSVYDLL
jgi:general secretion pathway protein G